MRTYWLTKRLRPELRAMMIKEWAPDLISTVDGSNGCCSQARATEEASIHQFKNIRSGSCNCATKSLYSRRSDDNVTSSHDASVLNKINEPVQINCNQLCVCRLNGSQLLNNRSPRSAPSITFRLQNREPTQPELGLPGYIYICIVVKRFTEQLYNLVVSYRLLMHILINVLYVCKLKLILNRNLMRCY